MGLQGANNLLGGRESTNILVVLNLPWELFKNTFTKIQAHTGMSERVVRYLVIEEALQTKIKSTLSHKNQPKCVMVCSIRREVNKNKVNVPLHIIQVKYKSPLPLGYLVFFRKIRLKLMPSKMQRS